MSHSCPKCEASCDCSHPGAGCLHLCLQLADAVPFDKPPSVLRFVFDDEKRGRRYGINVSITPETFDSHTPEQLAKRFAVTAFAAMKMERESR